MEFKKINISKYQLNWVSYISLLLAILKQILEKCILKKYERCNKNYPYIKSYSCNIYILSILQYPQILTYCSVSKRWRTFATDF